MRFSISMTLLRTYCVRDEARCNYRPDTPNTSIGLSPYSGLNFFLFLLYYFQLSELLNCCLARVFLPPPSESGQGSAWLGSNTGVTVTRGWGGEPHWPHVILGEADCWVVQCSGTVSYTVMFVKCYCFLLCGVVVTWRGFALWWYAAMLYFTHVLCSFLLWCDVVFWQADDTGMEV